jgi:hypothetical protein
MREWNGRCQRCYKETNGHTMSFLNTQLICFDCSKEEKNHPRYKEAKEAELRQVRAGNMNYKGLLG